MRVLTCIDGFNESTGACDGTQAYVEMQAPSPPLFIPLSAEDGFLITTAIVGVWAIGVKFRLMVRASRV